MRTVLLAAGMLLAVVPAFAKEAVKATVGHMCCGGCQAAATEGLKKLAWADNIAIDGTTVTVTAKSDQTADIVSLMDAMRKAGFPAREIAVSGPVTVTVGHMCCAGCANDLKTKVAGFKTEELDKESVKVDPATRTVVLQPAAGKTLNLVPLLQQMDLAGFGAVKCVTGGPAQSASK